MDDKGSYKELKVWHKAHQNTLDIYKLTKSFPADEKYGLISQIRRAIVSVEVNIVEGKFRKTNRDFARFLYISRGSNQEVVCLLEISKDLEIIDQSTYERIFLQLNEVNKMLNGLIKHLDK